MAAFVKQKVTYERCEELLALDIDLGEEDTSQIQDKTVKVANLCLLSKTRLARQVDKPLPASKKDQ